MRLDAIHAIDYEKEESLKITDASRFHNELPELKANILYLQAGLNLKISDPTVVDDDSGLIISYELGLEGAKYRRILEEGIELGWVIMDNEDESELDFRSFYWVHIASAKESVGHEANWVCFCVLFLL